MNKILRVIFVIGVLGNATAWAVEGDSTVLATGFDYSSGKYGSANTTDILSIPVVGIYKTGLWAFKLTVPYVRISGPGDVLPNGMRIKAATTTKSTKSTTHSGLGDIVAAATYNVYTESEGNPGVDLTGKIKFGTASTSLGTGQNDYAVQVDVYQSFDRFTPMAALGYEILGSPAGVDVNNVVYGSLGGDYKFTDQTNGGLIMRLAQKPSAIGADQRELSAYINHKLDEHLNISGYVLKGYSDGSPDSGFGVMVSSKF
ncbi:MAG TPA: transporter [Gallionella sp.]|nr:transporter [Gallionella sp.]